MVDIELIPIESNGSAPRLTDRLSQQAMIIAASTTELYSARGFVPPWIGYFAVRDFAVVGTCAFTSPPKDNVVEIAYFTFPEHEDGGIANAMASELVKVAQREDDRVRITAHTLVDRNASHRVLEKNKFAIAETIFHPEDGEILVWHYHAAQM